MLACDHEIGWELDNATFLQIDFHTTRRCFVRTSSTMNGTHMLVVVNRMLPNVVAKRDYVMLCTPTYNHMSQASMLEELMMDLMMFRFKML